MGPRSLVAIRAPFGRTASRSVGSSFRLEAMQIPSVLGTQRDSKNDSILGARREMQAPHDAMHRASMGATELQSNWPEMRKTLGKPGFCSTGFKKLTERTGTEQPTNSLGKSYFDTTHDAKYDACRFHCLRRLETLSITTNLQLLCSPIYGVTNSRPIQIYRVMVFRLQGHLQGHIKNPQEFTGSQFRFTGSSEQ